MTSVRPTFHLPVPTLTGKHQKLYLSEELKCPDFTDTILSLPDVRSLSLFLTQQSLFSFFDVFFVCDCSELQNTENQGVTLMALKCLPPPPIAFHPTTAKDRFCLRRVF